MGKTASLSSVEHVIPFAVLFFLVSWTLLTLSGWLFSVYHIFQCQKYTTIIITVWFNFQEPRTIFPYPTQISFVLSERLFIVVHPSAQLFTYRYILFVSNNIFTSMSSMFFLVFLATFFNVSDEFFSIYMFDIKWKNEIFNLLWQLYKYQIKELGYRIGI